MLKILLLELCSLPSGTSQLNFLCFVSRRETLTTVKVTTVELVYGSISLTVPINQVGTHTDLFVFVDFVFDNDAFIFCHVIHPNIHAEELHARLRLECIPLALEIYKDSCWKFLSQCVKIQGCSIVADNAPADLFRISSQKGFVDLQPTSEHLAWSTESICLYCSKQILSMCVEQRKLLIRIFEQHKSRNSRNRDADFENV